MVELVDVTGKLEHEANEQKYSADDRVRGLVHVSLSRPAAWEDVTADRQSHPLSPEHRQKQGKADQQGSPDLERDSDHEQPPHDCLRPATS
jgi:hypothetical protein